MVSDDNDQATGEGIDLPDGDIGRGIGELESTGESGDLGAIEPAGDGAAASTAGRRLVGLLAMVLGLAGVLLSVVVAFLALRLLFGASGAVDRAMDPIVEAFDRLEERIDETDDLIDSRGVDADQVPELQARVDGLVDVSSLAVRSFESIDDHPLYRFLPADLEPLGQSLNTFDESATAIEEQLGSGATVRSTAAARMSDHIDGMQSRVTNARERLDDATSSLRTWLRLGGLIGFLGALWGLWAQLSLLRRGWRGFRNRPV